MAALGEKEGEGAKERKEMGWERLQNEKNLPYRLWMPGPGGEEGGKTEVLRSGLCQEEKMGRFFFCCTGRLAIGIGGD